jgi:hypothetical protein
VLLLTTSNDDVQFMKSMGNAVSNARFEKRVEESGVVKPVGTSSKEQKGQYIVAKYVDRQFTEEGPETTHQDDPSADASLPRPCLFRTLPIYVSDPFKPSSLRRSCLRGGIGPCPLHVRAAELARQRAYLLQPVLAKVLRHW